MFDPTESRAPVALWEPGQSAAALIALLFGIVGYLMRRTEFSTAAFVIAFVLAKNAEEAFRQAMLLSDDGILIFVKEPVALAFTVSSLHPRHSQATQQALQIRSFVLDIIPSSHCSHTPPSASARLTYRRRYPRVEHEDATLGPP